jgi:hypothetical protein
MEDRRGHRPPGLFSILFSPQPICPFISFCEASRRAALQILVPPEGKEKKETGD